MAYTLRGFDLDPQVLTNHVEEESMERLQKRFPSEILGKIFIHCLDGEAVPVPPSPSPSMPWVLGQVCSWWRSVTFEEHQLWENVMFIPCKYFPRLALEEVIRRSGDSRIIHLNHVPSHYFQIILPTLLLHHNRFQSLKIEITRLTADLLTEMSQFKHLKSLSINYGHALYARNSDHASHLEFCAPPSLQSLTLSSDMPDQLLLHCMRISPVAPFWEHLAYLDVRSNTCIPVFTMLRILEQCKALIGCSLLLCNEPRPGPSDIECITVPSLQSITAQSVDPILTDFFASLNLPSLKILKMIGVSEMWPQREILALIDRSGCYLEEFHNANFVMPVECVMPLVRVMPFLARVSLDTDTPIPSSTIDIILTEALLPRLIFVTAWFDSSRAALKLVENTWARSEEPNGGIREGLLHINSADIRMDDEGCSMLKGAILQNGGNIQISVC